MFVTTCKDDNTEWCFRYSEFDQYHYLKIVEFEIAHLDFHKSIPHKARQCFWAWRSYIVRNSRFPDGLGMNFNSTHPKYSQFSDFAKKFKLTIDTDL